MKSRKNKIRNKTEAVKHTYEKNLNNLVKQKFTINNKKEQKV